MSEATPPVTGTKRADPVRGRRPGRAESGGSRHTRRSRSARARWRPVIAPLLWSVGIGAGCEEAMDVRRWHAPTAPPLASGWEAFGFREPPRSIRPLFAGTALAAPPARSLKVASRRDDGDFLPGSPRLGLLPGGRRPAAGGSREEAQVVGHLVVDHLPRRADLDRRVAEVSTIASQALDGFIQTAHERGGTASPSSASASESRQLSQNFESRSTVRGSPSQTVNP